MLLDTIGQPFTEVDLGKLQKEDSSNLNRELQSMTNSSTFPQVFIDGKYVGGYEEIASSIDSGRFSDLG